MTAAELLTRALAGLALAAPTAAWAQGPPARDFCAERPGATTPPCILDAGRLMAEIAVIDVTRARQDGGGWDQLSLAASPHLRLGLTDTVEAGITLLPLVREHGSRGGGPAVARSGFGDTVADLKIGLKNPDGSGVSVAVLPYVSIPTAQHGLGAGGFQGGVILPVALPLPSGFSLSLAPEADLLRGVRGGAHGALLGALSVGHGLGPGLSGAVEVIASVGEGAERRVRQTSVGASFAWTPPRLGDLQLDVGADTGLSRGAPAVRAYAGVSHRF